MELNDLLPNNDKNWIIKGDFLLYYKYQNIPTCFIGDDDIVYIFLDLKIKKAITKLIKFLIKKKIEFLLITPELSSPKGIDSYNYENVYNYVRIFTEETWLNEFDKIGFDPVDNLVKFIEKNDCLNLLKEIYELLKLDVNSKSYDPYKGDYYYLKTKEIRTRYENLYRDIQLTILLN